MILVFSDGGARAVPDQQNARPKVERVARWQHLLFVGFGAVATASLAVVWMVLIWQEEYDTGKYFAYRCLSLTNGIAPNLPVLLLILGFVWWGCVRLKAESMIEERASFVNKNQYLETPLERDPAENSGAKLIGNVDDSIQLLYSFRIWVPAILFFVVWFQIFVPMRSFRSLEYKAYDNLYQLTVLLFCWAVVVAWMQFIWCWDQFRAYLQWLERQPGRNAFDRLPRDSSWVPLVTATSERALFITSRCWDCLSAILSLQNFAVERNQAARTPRGIPAGVHRQNA